MTTDPFQAAEEQADQAWRDLARSIKEQIIAAQNARGYSKSELARRMNISRNSVNQLLDASVPSLSTKTLSRAAVALGLKIEIRLT